GCSTETSTDDVGFEFSLYLKARSQSSKVSLPANQCDEPCVFGQCILNDNNEKVCSCSVRFDGDYCSTCIGGWDTDSSAPEVGLSTTESTCAYSLCSFFNYCSDHGECDGDSLTGVQQCSCDEGYVGLSCDLSTPLVDCDADCENGGFCYAGTCQCPDGFGGTYCDEYECVDGCSESIGGGECDTSTGVCSCNDNFSGNTCSVYTSDESCQFGVSNGSGCTCQTNYNGTYCQCYNNCSTHGMCREWGCECEDGYSGDGCSVGEEPTIEDITVDLDNNTFTITFENAVSLDSLEDDVLEFDCSLIFDEDTYFGSCDLNGTGDGQRVLHERMDCNRNAAGTEMTITPGYASWLSPGMTVSLSSEIVSRLSRLSKDGLEVYLDRNLFPPQNPPVISPFFLPSAICVCENGGGEDLNVDLSALWYLGWGRVISSFTLEIEEEDIDQYTLELDEILANNSANTVSDVATGCSSMFVPYFAIPAELLYNLKQSGHDEILITVSFSSLFSVARAEETFTITLNDTATLMAFSSKGVEKYSLNFDFLYPIRIVYCTCKGDQIENDYFDHDSLPPFDEATTEVTDFPSYVPLLYNWDCINAKANVTYTYDNVDFYASANSLSQDVYSCSFSVKKSGNPVAILSSSLDFEARPVNLTVDPVENEEGYIISSASVHPDEMLEMKVESRYEMDQMSDENLDSKTIKYIWYLTDSDGRIAYYSNSHRLAFHVPEYVADQTEFNAYSVTWVNGDSDIGYYTHNGHITIQPGDVRDVNSLARKRGGLRVEIQGPSSIRLGERLEIKSRMIYYDKDGNSVSLSHMHDQMEGIHFKWSSEYLQDDELVELSIEGGLTGTSLSFTGEDADELYKGCNCSMLSFTLSVYREDIDDSTLVPIDTTATYFVNMERNLTFQNQLKYSSEYGVGTEASPFRCDAFEIELYDIHNVPCSYDMIKFDVDNNRYVCEEDGFEPGSLPLHVDDFEVLLDPIAYKERVPALMSVTVIHEGERVILIDNVSQIHQSVYVPCWAVMEEDETNSEVNINTYLASSAGSRWHTSESVFFMRGAFDIGYIGDSYDSLSSFQKEGKSILARTAAFLPSSRISLMDLRVHFDSFLMSEAISEYLLRFMGGLIESQDLLERALEDEASSEELNDIIAIGLYHAQGIIEFAYWFVGSLTNEDYYLHDMRNTNMYAGAYGLLCHALTVLHPIFHEIVEELPIDGGISANLEILEKIYNIASSHDLVLLRSPPARFDSMSNLNSVGLLLVELSNHLPAVNNYHSSYIAHYILAAIREYATCPYMVSTIGVYILSGVIENLYGWGYVKSSDIPSDFQLMLQSGPLYRHVILPMETPTGSMIKLGMEMENYSTGEAVILFDSDIRMWTFGFNLALSNVWYTYFKMTGITSDEFWDNAATLPIALTLKNGDGEKIACQGDSECIEVRHIAKDTVLADNLVTTIDTEETEYVVVYAAEASLPESEWYGNVLKNTPVYDSETNTWTFYIPGGGVYTVLKRSVVVRSVVKKWIIIGSCTLGGLAVLGLIALFSISLFQKKQKRLRKYRKDAKQSLDTPKEEEEHAVIPLDDSYKDMGGVMNELPDINDLESEYDSPSPDAETKKMKKVKKRKYIK
ncbi:hypothetical protein ADUPG1_006766, partial [Aduncisulcus paluster]